jgi:uncharacterized protein YbjT (DUF2867 family)
MTSYLVAGASGAVGSHLVKFLAAEPGAIVRALTSKPGRQDTERVKWVRADVLSEDGLAAAFSGVDRAFLLAPSGHANQHQVLAPLIREARRAKLEKVVLMTAKGADAVDASPFRRAELELERSGIAFNILRPNWFMQNFATFWARGIREQGKILLPAGAARVSFIDALDIAAVAARLLTRGGHEGKGFELTGAESLDHGDVAAVLSRVTGRRIVYEEISPRALRTQLLESGTPADYADFLLASFAFLREGRLAVITENLRALLGRNPSRLESFAQAHRGAWSTVTERSAVPA